MWASAAAPSAAIEMAACADTSTTFGGLIAIQNLINAAAPPPSIMSISYGQCENSLGTAGNAFENALWQQAAAQGITVVVAAGDNGAAGCDNPNSVTASTHGAAMILIEEPLGRVPEPMMLLALRLADESGPTFARGTTLEGREVVATREPGGTALGVREAGKR